MCALRLKSGVQELPSPVAYRDAVQGALRDAIALWQENLSEAVQLI
jgi:hypothetical protein